MRLHGLQENLSNVLAIAENHDKENSMSSITGSII